MADFNPNIKVDPKKFTIAETEEILEYTGKDDLQEVFAIFQDDNKSVTRELLNTVAILVTVSQRKGNPDYKIEDAKNVTMEEFQAAMKGGQVEDSEDEEGKEETE